ncbi:MAG: alpha/beta hydrolase [Bacteroidota bacterium]
MRINLIKGTPSTLKKDLPVVVFVHGAWHGAWCWEVHFLPYFVKNGFECYAFDLPLHGKSEDKSAINRMQIADYVEALSLAVAQINKPVILVGHSMGGYVVQQYLVNNDCAAVVLMASVVGKPILRLLKDIVFQYPWTMLKSLAQMDLFQLVDNTEKVRHFLFSADMPIETVKYYEKQLCTESYGVVFYDFMIKKIPQRQNLQVPLLIQCAENDQLVTMQENKYTADWQKGDFQFFENIAHDMMLEEEWQLVADGMIAWLKIHFPLIGDLEKSIPKNPIIKKAFPDAVPDLIATLRKNNEIDADATDTLDLGKDVERDN